MKAWLADRQGAIVGVDLAKRFGWKIGDRMPLKGTIYRPKNGGDTWEFNIVGIYDGEPGVDKTQLLLPLRLPRREPAASTGAGTVGWYVVKIKDASQSKRDGADLRRACSPTRRPKPRRRRRRGSSRASPSRSATSASIMIAILVAVLFTILLVVGNTMAQSVRERTSELAVLKTLGFSNAAILALVLAESLFIAVVGGGLGLAARVGDRAARRSDGRPAAALRPAAARPRARHRADRGCRRRRRAAAGGRRDAPQDHRRA